MRQFLIYNANNGKYWEQYEKECLMKDQKKYVKDFNMLLIGLFLIVLGLSILCWNTIITEETKTNLHTLLIEGVGNKVVQIRSGSLFEIIPVQ